MSVGITMLKNAYRAQRLDRCDYITLPREVAEKAVKAFENGCPPTCENGMVDSGGFHPWGEPALVPCPTCLAFEHLRTHLAEQPKPSEDAEALRRDAESWRLLRKCFDAAKFEGWETAIQSGDINRIRDLWQRRISHGLAAIDAAMGDKT